MNTTIKFVFLLHFTLCFCFFSIPIEASSNQKSSGSPSSNKKTAQPANKAAVLSKGYMTKAEFAAYVEKELAKLKDMDLDMSDEDKVNLAADIYRSLGISSIQNKPEKLSKNAFISSELSKAQKTKEYAEKSAKIEKDADRLYSVKKKGDPISIYSKTGKLYEGKFYGKTSSYITIDDHRVPLIDLSQDSLDLFSESAMSKKRADYVRREKQRLLPDTIALNEKYKKVESEASKKSFKDGYILSNEDWVSVKTLAVSVINSNIKTKKKHIEEETKKKQLAEEAEQKRLAEEAEQKRIAETGGRRRTGGSTTTRTRPQDGPSTGQRNIAEEIAEQRRIAEEAAEQKRIAEAAERKRLAEEAEQKSIADAAKWKRIAEESEEELKNASAFYNKDLEKNVYLIKNGPKQNITSDMNYEELNQAISSFALKTQKCKVAKELLPSFYNENGYFDYVKDCQDINKNEHLAYKEKKIMLIKYYDEVIKHIKEFYSQPIKQLEEKCLAQTSYFKSVQRGCCCEWHAMALAQRGSAKAQFQLGVSVMDLKNYEAYRIPSLAKFFDEESFQTDITWLKLAGENGVPKAYYILGKVSYNAESYENAIAWYKRGAEMNQTDCLYELGSIACKVKNFSAALSWFAKASDLGHVRATLECAELCETNYQDFHADYKKSIEYYKKMIKFAENGKGLSWNKSYEIDNYTEKIKKLELKIED